MNDLISIIIPVYNSELYIHDCIQSVLHQTYSEFEVILADDGSCDSNKKIYESICQSDKRITLYSYEHRGVSAARNDAMKAAKGIYIFFLDSDDIIHPRLLESLYSLLKETSSILATADCLKFKTANLFNKNYLNSEYSLEYTCIDTQIAIDMYAQRLTQVFDGIGGVMVLRSAIQSFSFDETLICGEDTKFIYQLLLQKGDVVILHRKWYFYRVYDSCSQKRNILNVYKSKYICESYIRNNELDNCRRLNALSLQRFILQNICGWFIAAKKDKNECLCEYLKDIAKKEKKSCLYPYCRPKTKRTLFLILNCFPLYMVTQMIWILYGNIRYHLYSLTYLKRIR